MQLSVIIPAYNAEKTIEKSIHSAVIECNNNNISYEILVINDGSEDNTLEIITELSNKNPCIKVFTQVNSGPSNARNNGLDKAKGDYIALLDSDDEWLPSKLKLQLDFLNSHPEIDLVTGEHSVKTKYQIPMLITFKKEAFHNYFCTQTVLFRNSIKRHKFPEDMKYSEDMRFFVTVMLKHNCYYLPGIVSRNVFDKRNFGDYGLSGNLKMMEKGELSNIKFMFKNKKISVFTYLFASLYSILKYSRRILITKIKG